MKDKLLIAQGILAKRIVKFPDDANSDLPNPMLDKDIKRNVYQAMLEFANVCVIEELKELVEHPTKPGYKRLDILNRIKFLEDE